MSLNRARPAQPVADIAASAVLMGTLHIGAGVYLAQGVAVRSRGGNISVGNHSAVLENSVLVGWRGHPVEIASAPSSGTVLACWAPTSGTCARSATARS